jgi:hypothetical protein
MVKRYSERTHLGYEGHRRAEIPRSSEEASMRRGPGEYFISVSAEI